MVAHVFLLPHVVHSIFTLFFLLSFVTPSCCEGDQDFSECLKPFHCGLLSNLSYPFWDDSRSEICGFLGLKLRCQEGKRPVISINNEEFFVKSVDQPQHVMTIALWETVCPLDNVSQFPDTSLNETPFSYVPAFEDITLFYNCTNQITMIPDAYRVSCGENGPRNAFYATDDASFRGQDLPDCNTSVKASVPSRELIRGLENLTRVLIEGFNVTYKFNHSCGADPSPTLFECLCREKPDRAGCPKDNNPNVPAKVGIGVGAFLGGVIACVIVFIYLRRRRKPYAPSSFVSKSTTSDFSKSDIEKGEHYFAVHLFSYSELEEATNNFDSAKELGDGGFGTVYYGKLRDGRAVAVKRLYENNYKRVEQFMNEVDILTRLHHQHLVSLYGCTSRHCRELLLVYEYIPNGTVADHLHGERAKPGALPWCTRIKIAVETASALAYLHASDIIHRDVKTNNILLDNNFCVKVADFGLSRFFPMDVTHVSTAPQGTPGYVDPEYHECYQLTDKSDVYSFGVVLVELISSMPAVDITRHRHEINLSNMAINKIQSDALDELVDHNLGFESDNTARGMITAVAELAFQCLQSAKELRPSMEQVLETLKEIQNKDYDIEKKTQETDIPSDDVGLLKSGQLPRSPDTVMMKWLSNSTTPNISG
ncbi:LEAF RUST 10 DISEASE-RESISTANCE LOCUS RECEPTOR-LIKE PROTEIN KINASE-like 1.2 isoform X3 [Hevea brasiliensis]|uniref:LEAF RUST 10 DISEASE-RESISTANCE LOCUS RECEPTOR-LIKE PROTEIN KINASE-like 1.2 isoform X3 n=1 Tax=Hevea brasiliensis TaxID=3981 RepID=UPI0025F5DBE5|nr:LEAF RUST 10 DISEASE-RESISTANCE LOCUS RECEPTOR-LIKE PROTEIN KINASE-like 1.2 isoform X3 [Hevea brasiliensis]